MKWWAKMRKWWSMWQPLKISQQRVSDARAGSGENSYVIENVYQYFGFGLIIRNFSYLINVERVESKLKYT